MATYGSKGQKLVLSPKLIHWCESALVLKTDMCLNMRYIEHVAFMGVELSVLDMQMPEHIAVLQTQQCNYSYFLMQCSSDGKER